MLLTSKWPNKANSLGRQKPRHFALQLLPPVICGVSSKNMDIREQILDCDKCGQKHTISIDFSQLSDEQRQGKKPVLNNYICPNIALMYRVMGFVLDTRVNAINSLREHELKDRETGIVNEFKAEWGELDFDAKLDRFMTLDLAFLGVPEEYYNLLNSVVSSYCCGYFIRQ